MGHLVAKDGLDNITALDKGRVVHAAFNQHGADIRMKREDWPRVTERQRWRFMSQLLLEKLSAASAVDEYVLFQNLSCSVGSGSKKSAFSRGTTSSPAGELSPSRKKTQARIIPKDREERTVPIPDRLVEILSKHRSIDAKGQDLSSNFSQPGVHGQRRRTARPLGLLFVPDDALYRMMHLACSICSLVLPPLQDSE